MSEALTPAESVRLVELERVIERGKTTFVEVGKALEEIRDQKLYKPKQTFEEYCQERWGFTRMHASRLIMAAGVVENVTGRLQSAPSNIEQTRPLSKLPADQQPAAWEKAVEKAAEEGKPVTARHVEEAVAEAYPAPHHGAWSEEADAKGQEAEKESPNLWLLKSTWRKASKKDHSAFLAWVETVNTK